MADDTTGLRHGLNLRNFWISNTVSAAGTQVSLLALPLLALTTLHAEGWQLGVLSALQYAPTVLLGLYAGKLIDHWPLHRSLVWANVLSGLTVLAITGLHYLGLLDFANLCVLGFTLGTLRLYIELGNHSFGPSIFTKDRLVQANSRINTGSAVAETAGPGLGGLLIELLQAPYAIVLNGVSFFVSAYYVNKTKPLAQEQQASTPPQGGVLQGIRTVFANSRLKTLAFTSCYFNVCLRASVVAFTVYAVQEIGLSAGMIGTCVAVGGAGGVLGAALAGRVGRRLDVGPSISLGIVVACLGMFVVPWGFGTVGGFAVAGVGLFVQWLGLGIYNVHSLAFRQTTAPSDQLGRVNASYRLISHGSIPIGALAGGVAASLIGPRTTLVVAGAIALAGAVLTARAMMSIHTEQSDPVPATGR